MPLSDELRDLYQQVILDHSRNPRNHGEIPPPCLHAHGDNPSCGDEIDVWLRLDDNGAVEDLKFTGQGCAISQASASMMTQKIKGKSREQAAAMREDFRRVVMGDGAPADEDALGELILLDSV
jgi:nitrogen fixation protein NifU and related proteins